MANTDRISSDRGNTENASETAAAHTRKRKKHRVIPVLVILVLLAAIAGAVHVFHPAELREGYKAYTLLNELAKKPQLSMALNVDAVVDGTAVSVDASIEKQQVNDHNVTTIKSGAVTLFFSDAAVFLENGNAYQISSVHPDQSQMLDQVMELFRYVDVSAEEGVYTITAEAENAAALLDMLIPAFAGEFGNTQILSVEIATENDAVSEIRFHGAGNMETQQNTAYKLSAVLTVLPDTAMVAGIPQRVLDAIEAGASKDLTALTDDILRLATAWHELINRDQVSTTVAMSTDCGPLAVSDQLELHFVSQDHQQIGVLQKGDFTLYFAGNTVCDKYGHSVSSERRATVETAKLFEIVYELCMISDASCTQTGEGYVYSLKLDEDAMKAVAAAIAPETANMDIHFENGSVALLVEGGTIQNITISCAGSVRLLISTTDADITVNIKIRENKPKITVPQNVLNAFSGKT